MTVNYTWNIGPKQVEAFKRYLSKLPHGDDLTLLILKGHLLLEEQVRGIVDERLVSPEALNDSRFDCHQVICLAEALCPKDVDPALWKAAKKLNSIRNAVAHNLDPKGLIDRIGHFVELHPSDLNDESDTLQDKFEGSLLHLFLMMSLLTEKNATEFL